MKKFNTFTFLLAITLMTLTTGCTQDQEDTGKVLRHVVLIKFKDGSTPSDIKKVEDAFAALSTKIPLIKRFEWGTNNSHENLSQGLTHCFLATFGSEEDRDAYLVHPEHKAFVEILIPNMDKITVVDYWTK